MPLRKTFLIILAIVGCTAFSTATSRAQEGPYFVTYNHYLEEPGNLEIEYSSTFGTQRGGNDFHAYWMEFEYGVKASWTTGICAGWSTIFPSKPEC